MKTRTRQSIPTWQLDAVIVFALTLLAFFLCAKFNVSELLLSLTRSRERYQLDELPVVLLVLAFASFWFATRRRRETQCELVARRAAEARAAAALAENRRLTQLYLELQEAERKAIARDLHDDLGQHLSALKLDAVSLRDRLGAHDPRLPALAQGMLDNIERMHGAVLGMIRQLRPVGLDELGLAAALEHCVDEWRQRLPQMAIELCTGAALDRLDEPRQVAFYRLVQEAMTNVARHSHARHVSIRIDEEVPVTGDCSRLVVEVDDDGVGADLGANHRGLGLVGMRERAQTLGGEVSIRSQPRSGFTVRAHIPVGPTT
jgi:signal transduction histidine kinase